VQLRLSNVDVRHEEVELVKMEDRNVFGEHGPFASFSAGRHARTQVLRMDDPSIVWHGEDGAK